jgi:type IV secretory pathway VirB4 component
MFRLATALKGYREAGSLNDQINLFGFVDDHTFLTKTGDLGVVLAIKGVDYECLANSEIDNYTKRLESAFKILDDKCRIYQYLFKGSNPDIPSKSHENTIVNAAIESRIAYLKGKAQSLYGLTIYFVILLENPPAKRTLSRILTTVNSDLKQYWGNSSPHTNAFSSSKIPQKFRSAPPTLSALKRESRRTDFPQSPSVNC